MVQMFLWLLLLFGCLNCINFHFILYLVDLNTSQYALLTTDSTQVQLSDRYSGQTEWSLCGMKQVEEESMMVGLMSITVDCWY